MAVEMELVGIEMERPPNIPCLVLREAAGAGRVLPIFIGGPEATAIAFALEEVETPRPMTHDLIKSLLLGLNTGLRKVVVSELKDDTFYAVIWIEQAGRVVSVDSRPSDALALALRMDCPIYVDEEVLASSKVTSAISDKSTAEEMRKWLEGLGDDDLGRYKM